MKNKYFLFGICALFGCVSMVFYDKIYGQNIPVLNLVNIIGTDRDYGYLLFLSFVLICVFFTKILPFVGFLYGGLIMQIFLQKGLSVMLFLLLWEILFSLFYFLMQEIIKNVKKI